jgi:hypothetical protein
MGLAARQGSLATATFPELLMTAANVSLEEEYRLTRTALVKAGLDMTASMDALYRDWRRRRDKLESMARLDRVGRYRTQWWARHLAQFRCLINRSCTRHGAGPARA